MRFASFRIRNFKGFDDSGWQTLASSRNIAVGENNSGKTAMLEGLGLNFSLNGHKTIDEEAGYPALPFSFVDFEFAISGNELKKFMLHLGGEIAVPVPPNLPDPTAEDASDQLARLLARNEIVFGATKQSNGWAALRYPSFNLFQDPVGGPHRASAFTVTPDKRGFAFTRPLASRDDFGVGVAQHFGASVYLFSAERFGLAKSNVGANQTLNKDGRNLAEVLQNLQADRPQFGVFLSLVRKVLPEIKQISIRNVGNNQAEIFLSAYEEARNRADLFVSLADSGTGVGQVLAILYVLVASADPRTVIIDEPNSFLHPRAVRRLVAIIKDYSRHQFIISTHSPEVITSIEPERLFLARWSGKLTEIRVLDAREIGASRAALEEVGARLSDVYGADRVLWVEGPTEERCFPIIIKECLHRTLVGTTISAIPATGDLLGKRRKIIFEIYRKLSGASALIPVALAFVFDREVLSDEDMNQLGRESGGLIRFLPRRCYENFLLDPTGIAAILTSANPEGEPVTVGHVTAWLATNGSNAAYFKKTTVRQHGTPEWEVSVDGAEVLKQLFWDLRVVPYEKTKHSFDLTIWVLANNRGRLDELLPLLRAVIPAEE